MHLLQPGDSLRFITGIPGYQWRPNKYSEIALIAGGAGITPMYQLIRGIFDGPDAGEEMTNITLVFGVNSDADVLLKQEFDEYERRFPGRFRAIYTVSNPVPSSPHRKGYVDRELLEELGLGAVQKASTRVFVCGPPAMETALIGGKGRLGILQQLGYTKDQIHKF